MTTACKWDQVIPFAPLWEHFKRLLKPRGAVVLFGTEPFSSHLRLSNLKWYKYDWVWDKVNSATGLLANIQPLRVHENVVIFYDSQATYNPQMTYAFRRIDKRRVIDNGEAFGGSARRVYDNENVNYPRSVLTISNANQHGKTHPTEKPLALLEYLVKTYTNPGMIVLDPTMGSGTTGHACVNLDRRFVGIELEQKYFEIAKDRIQKAERADKQLRLL